MKGLTLKHIRYFIALCETGHFGLAAEQCNISQPALSLQIKEFETIIGAPLFERTPRGVTLTTMGEDTRAHALKIMETVGDLELFASQASRSLSGRLRLGIIPTIAPYFLPQAMTTLSQKYPALQVQPRESQTQNLVRDLMASKLDIAVLALPISEAVLTEFPLFDEEFLYVCPAYDAAAPTPNADELKAMQLLLLEEGHCFRDQALSFCQINSRRATNIMEGSSLTTLVQMVGAGIGVTLIPEMASDLEAAKAEVAVKRFAQHAPYRTVGMVWRRSSPMHEQYAELAHALSRCAAKPSALD